MTSPATADRWLAELKQDPTDPSFFNDPFHRYAQWHEQSGPDGPVFFWHEYQCWIFGGMDIVNALFRSKDLGRRMPITTGSIGDQWSRKPAHVQDFYKAEEFSLLELEPPSHTRLRKLINAAFLARQIQHMSDGIARECDALIDGFSSGRPIDLIANFAEPLAVTTIARMLGIDIANGPRLLAWSHAMVRMYLDGRSHADEVAANDAARVFQAWLATVIEDKRAAPDDGLISHLVTAHDEQGPLSLAEITSTVILLLNAGHEASVHAFGNGAKLLLNAEPRLREDWLRDPDAFVEEVLRIAPPLHLFFRYVLTPVTIAGVSLNPGDRIGLHIGLANHDPCTVENPSQFLPGRKKVKNTAFGAGIHFCIGHTLARLELAIAFSTLFERLPDLRLAEVPSLKNAYHFHGYESLMASADGAS